MPDKFWIYPPVDQMISCQSDSCLCLGIFHQALLFSSVLSSVWSYETPSSLLDEIWRLSLIYFWSGYSSLDYRFFTAMFMIVWVSRDHPHSHHPVINWTIIFFNITTTNNQELFSKSWQQNISVFNSLSEFLIKTK